MRSSSFVQCAIVDQCGPYLSRGYIPIASVRGGAGKYRPADLFPAGHRVFLDRTSRGWVEGLFQRTPDRPADSIEDISHHRGHTFPPIPQRRDESSACSRCGDHCSFSDEWTSTCYHLREHTAGGRGNLRELSALSHNIPAYG